MRLTLRTNAAGTNFLLTAGAVCLPTNVNLSCRFTFSPDDFQASTNITVLPLPKAFTLEPSLLASTNLTVLIHLTGDAGHRYMLETTDSLATGHIWTKLWTNSSLNDCSWFLTFPANSPTGQRFYRARELP